ncbi:alkaline phosphatase [Mesobacillus jeotgali]|uniref:Alkaline phosphatase n=1 Tax=Mesobacillus jeotgali TaxID=129985 RepID=A0ABY9VJI5_9BACI|nr:alkaline phosphatase [Mesobacillus jeotgali]WNF21121.1 alkaline phosphatase [Mesobacillus jeotgali]
MNNNFKKKLIPFAVVSTLAIGGLSGAFTADAKESPKQNNAKIKNVIFMIGDGMGVSYTSAYRYLKDDPNTKLAEGTEFDKYLVGQQSTYAEDPEQNITDSASSATAMSAGVKTYNAAIGVDNDKSDVKTVLESAKEQGKATGLVATSEITHATPASFGAHDESRRNMNAIAEDYYDDLINGEHKVDVLLGGGTDLFVQEDRNLIEEFQHDGYSFASTKEQLASDNNEKILGLFAPRGLPKMIDRTEDIPSLEEMTKSAIERLNKDKDGFFLMVEGSQIDWSGHDNDIVGAMSEMEDYEKAFKAAIDFAKKDKHTLVIATADHSTGGYSIGADGIYNWFPEPIKAAKRTPDFMAAEIADGADIEETLSNYIDLELTSEEIDSVKAAAQGDVTEIDNAIEEIFNKRSHTGWTTSGHTGEDVNVYAFGPTREALSGKIENTDLAKHVFSILQNGNKEIVIEDK